MAGLVPAMHVFRAIRELDVDARDKPGHDDYQSFELDLNFMSPVQKHIAVIGAGPAGLMAAEVLTQGGAQVTVYDAMPSAGRKLLMAGRGGLNLTHSEPLPQFLARYRKAMPRLGEAIPGLPPDAVRAWSETLGEATFVGSSGRVFPKGFKASPLLRAWLRRLDSSGVQ